MDQFDLMVIGAGPGGYTAAIRAAQRGLSTAVVERRDVGGTCLNRGCIPTKALLHASGLYARAKNAADVGITVSGLGYDLDAIHARKREVVSTLRTGVEQLLQANGVTLLRGEAKLTQPGQVTVDGTDFAADKVIIATGSRPAKPPIPGLDLPAVYNSDDLLEGDPPEFKSLAIIGGGVIGVEFAHYYQELGLEVTLIEGGEHILPAMDRELTTGIARLFKRRKVKIHEQTMVESVSQGEAGLIVHASKNGKPLEVEAEAVLVALGRWPVTDNLFGPGMEPALFGRYLKVNEQYETSLPGVYAIGDVIGGMQLAHKAEAEAKRVIDVINGQELLEDVRFIPSCVYTSPEIASCGLSEQQATDLGIATVSGKYSTGGNAKTLIDGAERGFFKVVAEHAEPAGSGKVLGVHILSERASDMIGEISAELSAGLTVDELLKGIRPHPTFGEGLMEALEAIKGESILSLPALKR